MTQSKTKYMANSLVLGFPDNWEDYFEKQKKLLNEELDKQECKDSKMLREWYISTRIKYLQYQKDEKQRQFDNQIKMIDILISEIGDEHNFDTQKLYYKK